MCSKVAAGLKIASADISSALRCTQAVNADFEFGHWPSNTETRRVKMRWADHRKAIKRTYFEGYLQA